MTTATTVAKVDQFTSNQDVKTNQDIQENIVDKASQKRFAAAGIGFGTLASLGGAAGLTVVALKSTAAMALLAPLGIKLGIALLGLSALFASNPLTLILCIFTLPAAAFCFALPVTLPILLGSLPGAVLAGFSISKMIDLFCPYADDLKLGDENANKGNMEEAYRCYSKALEMAPLNRKFHVKYDICEKLNSLAKRAPNPKLAEQYYKCILQLDPYNSSAICGLRKLGLSA